MNKIKLINSFIAVGIIFIITGGILNVLHRPDSETFILIGKCFTILFSLIAVVEIFTSPKRSYVSKAIWLLCFIYFSPFAVLVYFFKWQNGFGINPLSNNIQ